MKDLKELLNNTEVSKEETSFEDLTLDDVYYSTSNYAYLDGVVADPQWVPANW